MVNVAPTLACERLSRARMPFHTQSWSNHLSLVKPVFFLANHNFPSLLLLMSQLVWKVLQTLKSYWTKKVIQHHWSYHLESACMLWLSVFLNNGLTYQHFWINSYTMNFMWHSIMKEDIAKSARSSLPAPTDVQVHITLIYFSKVQLE